MGTSFEGEHTKENSGHVPKTTTFFNCISCKKNHFKNLNTWAQEKIYTHTLNIGAKKQRFSVKMWKCEVFAKGYVKWTRISCGFKSNVRDIKVNIPEGLFDQVGKTWREWGFVSWQWSFPNIKIYIKIFLTREMEPEYVDWRVILVLYDISMNLQNCKLSIQKHILKVTEIHCHNRSIH